MANDIVFDEAVDWTGENPGVYLKEAVDGPWVTLASFFRVFVSPHGPGTAMLLLASPGEASSSDAAPNLCITDNEPLARWLISDFAANFGFFRDSPALAGLNYVGLESIERGGDALTTYSEAVSGGGYDIKLDWQGMGEPFALVIPQDASATGKHTILSLFVGAEGGMVTLNGSQLPGHAVPHNAFGQQITSAFLAFSETWIRHD